MTLTFSTLSIEMDQTLKKVLILGITGFVGPYLAEEFLANGYLVCGADIKPSESLNTRVQFITTDLLNPHAIESLLVELKPSHIINLAAISSVGLSWELPQKTIEVNVIGTINLLEAAKKLEPTPKILLIGSSEEYEISNEPIQESNELNSNNPYGISKMMQEKFAELYIKRDGLKIYRVRSFNHTGIGQLDSFVLPSFCKQVAEIDKSNQPGSIYVGNLSVKRDFSNVKDIVKAYCMIIESNFQDTVFNVGSGSAYSLNELLDYIISLSKQKISIVTDPEKYRPNDNKMICCDNRLITEKLSWKPQHDIFSTLKEMYDYYRTQ